MEMRKRLDSWWSSTRREDADYRPDAFLDNEARRNALRDMKAAGLILKQEL